MAEISVLVPVCNVERYVGECLDSILAQTFTDYEVICMDDGSTDRSGAILDQYALRDCRIKVIHKVNSGYGNTMNEAIRIAKGRYISIVESDDMIENDMLQAMYQTAVSYDLDMVKTDFYQMWKHEDGTEGNHYAKLTLDSSFYGRVIEPNAETGAYFLQKFTWNALYKRAFLNENHIRYNETPGASFQDNGFWFQTFYWAKRAMFLNRAFYKYRQDNPNSSFRSRQKEYAMKNEYDFIHHFLTANHVKHKELYHICFHFRLLGYLFTLNRIDDSLKEQFAVKIQEECGIYEKNGEAYYKWLSQDQKEVVEQIRRNPVGYAKRIIKRNREIKEIAAGHPHIVIYRAGAYGMAACSQISGFQSEGQTVDVAVTDLHGQKQYCLSKSVREIKEYVDEKDKCLVLLAVKEESEAFGVMLENLKKLGFANIRSYGGLLK